MAENAPPSPTPSQLPPVPASPTYSYASTANPLAQYNLPPPPPPRPLHAVLTKADLENSQTAYGDLLTSAKTYRVALASLSSAASAFGSALESCARLKEARADAISPPAAAASLSNSFNAKGSCTADGLLAASGLQHLVANHHQILSETVYRSFEVPLLHELDKWRAAVDDEETAYDAAVRAQSREIRRLEKEGLRLHRQRRRDVADFREHLVRLTTRLDGLTTLHTDHARTLLRESQDTSSRILDASCSLVRAEVDIFEGLARKGWTGGGLEDLLEKGVDLFAADDQTGDDAGARPGGGGQGAGGGGGGEGNKLFSILPPMSILADSATTVTSPDADIRSDPRPPAASAAVATDADGHYQSLAGAVAATADTGPRGRDDAYSFDPNRPRAGGVRPFSPPPQPVRLNPDALVGWGSEEEEDDDDTERGGEPIPAASTARQSDADPGSMSLTLDPVVGGRDEEEDAEDAEEGMGREQDQLLPEEGVDKWRNGDTLSASVESLQHDRGWGFAEDDGER